MARFELDGTHVYNGTMTIYLRSDVYVSYSGIMNWSVGEIQRFLSDAVSFIESTETEPIDLDKVLLLGKSVVSESLGLRYQRPATQEEIDNAESKSRAAKVERRNALLADLEEIEKDLEEIEKELQD